MYKKLRDSGVTFGWLRFPRMTKKAGPPAIALPGLSACGSGRWRAGFTPIKSGFTLIELIVVMAIIGILASFAISNTFNSFPKTRDAKRKNDLKQMQTALQLYYQDYNQYPNTDEIGFPGVLCSWSTHLCWPNLFGPQGISYIKQVPTDPLNKDLGACDRDANCYIYRYCRPLDQPDRYIIVANLENPNDPDINNTDNNQINNCPTGGPNRYFVTNP